jgi:Domain of unknown function (DUF3846)
MKGRIVIFPHDRKGRIYAATKHPSLHRIRKVVGGYIELVPLWTSFLGDPCVAYCNEEGKLEGLPVNGSATIAWYRNVGRHMDDVLCGNVIVIVNLPEETREEWRD